MFHTVCKKLPVMLSKVAHKLLGALNIFISTFVMGYVLLASSAMPAVAQVGNWTTDSITTGGDTNNFVSVTTDSVGNFHGAWRPDDGSDGFIEIGFWNGSSWTVVSSFDTSDSSLFDSFSDDVDVAMDSTGNYHLAFQASRGGGTSSTRGIFYAMYDVSTATWTIEEVQTASHPNGWINFDNPAIDVDSSDQPHMAFLFSDASDNINPPRPEEVRYAVRIGSNTWSITTIDATSNSFEIREVDFKLDSFDNACIAYTKETVDQFDQDLWFATNASGSFTTTQLVSADSNTGPSDGVGSISLALDSSDSAHIAYAFGSFGSTTLNYITNAGGSFSSPTVAVSGGDHGSPNAIGVNGSADLKVIVYRDDDTSPPSLRAATKIGSAAWQDEEVWFNAGDDFGTAGFMDAVMSDNGEIMALFHRNSDDTGDDRRVMFAFGTLSVSVCGNGIVDSGEDCDGSTCCASDCSFAGVGTSCGDSATACSGQDTCDGAGTCQPNHLVAGTPCGDPLQTVCDGADTCDGGGECNENLAPDDTPCDDSDACSTTDICSEGLCVGGFDTTLPMIDCGSITPNRSTDAGVCTFTMPGTGFDVAFSDNCTDPAPTLSNDFNSSASLAGATFQAGATHVSWTVTDGAGATAMCSVHITITDDESPTIVCPADLEIEPTGNSGAAVTYDAPMVVDNCPGVTYSCNPGAGSQFGFGDATVTCTANDGSDNPAACTFMVTVLDAAGVIENVIDEVNVLGTAGILNGGQTNALLRKLEHAFGALERQNSNVSCNTLTAFINQIRGLTSGNGVLSEAQGQQLIDSVSSARAALDCDAMTQSTINESRRQRRK